MKIPSRIEIQKHFEKLTRYFEDLKSLLEVGFVAWVNGSYVTKKPNPRDIDVVVFIPWQKAGEHYNALKKFSRPEVHANYGVDGYLVRVYEPEHRSNILTVSDRLHWQHDFSRTQANRQGKTFRKGFLEINY